MRLKSKEWYHRNILNKNRTKMQNWIDVKDRFPEVENDMVKVLGWDGYQVLHVNYFKYEDEQVGSFRVNCIKCFNEISTITHWMPLPKPPVK